MDYVIDDRIYADNMISKIQSMSDEEFTNYLESIKEN